MGDFMEKVCPVGHGEMVLTKVREKVVFRDIALEYDGEFFTCSDCGFEMATVKQTAATQRGIADAYRERVGLLTGENIRHNRKVFGLTQQDLADRLGVGVASIKRWENGVIQNKGYDSHLRNFFLVKSNKRNRTGGRVLSLPRIKLVLRKFEECLGRDILAPGDRFLYAAKYLWYADMMAFSKLGRGMTGAEYAKLPNGPQLNNYRELVGPIMDSDKLEAEPLADEEVAIIEKVSKRFPTDAEAFSASHKELVWQEKNTGWAMPYSDSERLTEL